MPGPNVASKTNATTNGATSLVLNTPSPINNGDLMVVTIFTLSQTPSTTPGVTPPTGWTIANGNFPVRDTSGITRRGIWVYWKIASNEPASYTWNFTDPGGQAAVMDNLRITSAAASSPIDDANGQINASSSTCTAPSINGTANDILIDIFASGVGNTQTYTKPGGSNQDEVNLSATGISYSVCDEAISSTGATGTRTSTMGTASVSYGATVTILPGPLAPPNSQGGRPNSQWDPHFQSPDAPWSF